MLQGHAIIAEGDRGKGKRPYEADARAHHEDTQGLKSLRLGYYTGIFQGKGQNFPGVQPRFFGALQCSKMAFLERRTEA